MSRRSAGHGTTGCRRPPAASFWAAGIAQIVTRPLDERDHFCGNEVVAYRPSRRRSSPAGLHPRPRIQGRGAGDAWDDPNCRSSFVGHFAY